MITRSNVMDALVSTIMKTYDANKEQAYQIILAELPDRTIAQIAKRYGVLSK